MSSVPLAQGQKSPIIAKNSKELSNFPKKPLPQSGIVSINKLLKFAA